jgi:hypothetical protein
LRTCLLAAVLLAFLPAPTASADILATFDHDSPGSAGQLRRVNATTGAAVPLPPSADDPAARELHPSLSPGGKYLVFKRQPLIPVRGGVRIVMVELATGRSADLFTPSESNAAPPTTPTFSLDGTKVMTGRPFQDRSLLTETDVRSFPTGPFPHRVFVPDHPPFGLGPGRTLQPSPYPTSIAFGNQYDSGRPGPVTTGKAVGGGGTIGDPTHVLADPTVNYDRDRIVFTSTPLGTTSATRLVSATLHTAVVLGDLPEPVNLPRASTSTPAFTRNGRYLAFVRRDLGTNDFGRLFIWDTETQLLLNPSGVPAAATSAESEIALEVRLLISGTALTSSGVSFTLTRSSSTGLLVQRIVGRRKLLGRRAPKLKRVGKVPLGKFRKGRHRKRYHFTVRGHKLRPGCYLITVRALTRKKKVRDLSTPYTVRIRKHRRPRVRKGVRLRACRHGKR